MRWGIAITNPRSKFTAALISALADMQSHLRPIPDEACNLSYVGISPMILVDTGPFIALFDPQDAKHTRCKEILHAIREPLFTTISVLTEAFHLLTPNSVGADRLRDFILDGGVFLWFLDQASTERVFELMEQYGDIPWIWQTLLSLSRWNHCGNLRHRHVKVDILG